MCFAIDERDLAVEVVEVTAEAEAETEGGVVQVIVEAQSLSTRRNESMQSYTLALLSSFPRYGCLYLDVCCSSCLFIVKCLYHSNPTCGMNSGGRFGFILQQKKLNKCALFEGQ